MDVRQSLLATSDTTDAERSRYRMAFLLDEGGLWPTPQLKSLFPSEIEGLRDREGVRRCTKLQA